MGCKGSEVRILSPRPNLVGLKEARHLPGFFYGRSAAASRFTQSPFAVRLGTVGACLQAIPSLREVRTPETHFEDQNPNRYPFSWFCPSKLASRNSKLVTSLSLGIACRQVIRFAHPFGAALRALLRCATFPQRALASVLPTQKGVRLSQPFLFAFAL